MFAASYGIAFGAIQQLPQILGAPIAGTWQILAEGAAARTQSHGRRAGARRSAAARAAPAADPGQRDEQAVARVTFLQEIGGLAGRFALALLAVVDRQPAPAAARLPDSGAALRAALLLVDRRQLDDAGSLTLIKVGIFVAGFFTVAQLSFWGNYIPLVFPCTCAARARASRPTSAAA